MSRAFRGWSLGCVVTGALLTSATVRAQDAEGVVRLGTRNASGVVRISDQSRSAQVYRGQSEPVDSAQPADVAQMSHCEVEPGDANSNCPPAGDVVQQGHVGLMHRALSWIHNDLSYKSAWVRGHCGNGHCGHEGPGRPLAGCYNMVYPVDPGYFDQRDGQVYAAPGYGGPVSVPLAPVVNSTYNYGWGVPSSRLTPVLHPATQAPISRIPNPIPSAPVSY